MLTQSITPIHEAVVYFNASLPGSGVLLTDCRTIMVCDRNGTKGSVTRWDPPRLQAELCLNRHCWCSHRGLRPGGTIR